MTDRNTLVTEDELHAYIDNELPADRRGAVEDWLSAHPDDAARVADWQAQADAIRARYGEVSTQSIGVRFDLDRMTRNRRSWGAAAAAAILIAFVFGGVAGWMARGASAAAPGGFASLTAEAQDAHKLYVVEVRHPVEVPAAERDHLVRWLSKRLGHQLHAPELEGVGLKLVGGRLLPGPSGPSAFFMYESPSGERFTIYGTSAQIPESALRYTAAERVASVYWVDHGFGYAVSGPPDRKRLMTVAQAAYDQIEKPARSN
jgi:anti-sigma factor RsiW